MINAHDVEHAAFGRAKKGKSGYDEVSVDDFLDRVVATLEAIEQGRPTPAEGLTSTDVVEAVFEEKGPETDGGYDLDDVDDLLDRVAQRLFEHEKSVQPSTDQRASRPVGEESLPMAQTPARSAVDDPGELVDNDHAAHDPVYSRDELRSPAGEPNDDLVHVVRGGDTARDESVVASRSHDGTSEREPELAGINPVGGEAVDEKVTPEEQPSETSAQHEASPSTSASVGSSTDGGHETYEPTFGEAVGASEQTANSSIDEGRNVEQYPATDHRVPLPRGDMSSQLSEDDVRAQQNYHPEFSEYDTEGAARRAEASSATVHSDEGSVEGSHDAGELPVQSSNAGAPPEAQEESFAPFAEHSRVADQPMDAPAAARHEGIEGDPFNDDATRCIGSTEAQTEQNHEPTHMADVDRETVAAEPVVTARAQAPGRDAATGNPVPSVNDSVGEAEQTPVTDSTPSTGVEQAPEPTARPQQIDRPEPIDRPRELPKRAENTRKGFLRRLFRG